MNFRQLIVLTTGLTLVSVPAAADISITPFVGYRMGSSIDIESSSASTSDQVRFKDSVSQGLILNFDLQDPGTQGELYFGRQETSAKLDNGFFAPGTQAIDVTIYQLQFGGLYFPGGKSYGGFASGVLGVARLEPDDSAFDTHHRASLSLGGGYQFLINEQLRLRLDLRGIYTALDSGGSVFCSGGCEIRYRSSGYLQVEAGAGLVLRF
ncbi:hypothetical protein [Marinobacter sp.]|uniref:hypothetical protein n=1 Tax=Marinobacter sp. TaxID=50741 RepID=UPI003A8DDD2C